MVRPSGSIGFALACLVSLGGCGSKHAMITIGAILSQTGTLATAGQDHLLAAQLAVDQINAAGGVNGLELQLINADDRSEPSFGGTAADTLIDAYDVPAILGAVSSDSTLAAVATTSTDKVVLLSGSATTPQLTGYSPYFFRTCSSDARQGKLLAERAVAKGFTKIAIVSMPGAYGLGLATAFASDFTAAGGTITFNRMFTPSQSSYVPLLAEVYATPPDAILLVAYSVDGAQIVRDYLSDYSFEPTFWFFTDSTEDVSFVEGVGASNFSFMHEGSGPADPSGSGYSDFASAFAARYGTQPQGYSPGYYDAAWLVALAMQAAQKSDGPSLRAKLRAVADPPGMVVGPGQWAAARAALAATGDVNYEGASGSVDLDANGDSNGAFEIWKVEAGVITVVAPSITP